MVVVVVLVGIKKFASHIAKTASRGSCKRILSGTGDLARLLKFPWQGYPTTPRILSIGMKGKRLVRIVKRLTEGN